MSAGVSLEAGRSLSWGRALFEMARSQFLVVATRPMNLATGVIAPAMLLALLVLPRMHTLGARTAVEVIAGVLLASLWAASLWSGAGIIRRERWSGTLAPSFTGKLSALVVILGKTLGGVLYDTSLILATTFVFFQLVPVDVSIVHPAAFAFGLLCVIFGGVASSLMLGGALVLSRHAFQLTSALGTPVMLLGGTIIPHRMLPDWIALPGKALNIAWFQQFLVSTSTSSPRWGALAIGVGLSLLYAVLGTWALRVLLKRARQEATLELI